MHSPPQRRYTYWFWIILVALVILDRLALLQQFTFQFVDDDQSIMWYAAKELAAGNFREPCFYGQPYGVMFESLIAVPLLYCNVSYPVALTLSMSFVTLFPYVLISLGLFRREQFFQSLLVLLVPLVLPVEFGMITAISRGVLTGLFFASFGIFLASTKFRWRFVAFGFFAVLGLFANPSCIIILFPAGLWLLFEHHKEWKFYVQVLLGALPASMIWAGALLFYKAHPEYVVHGSYSLDFSLKILKPYEWDKFFGHVTPLFWFSGLMVFPVLIAIAVWLIRQGKKSPGYALLAGVVLLFFSLTSFKVHYGYESVFLSYARMFTAVPLLIAVFLSQVNFTERWTRLAPIIPVCGLIFCCIKFYQTPRVVEREITRTEKGMFVWNISSLQTLCDSVAQAAQVYNVELLVVGDDTTKHLMNYGCPCLNQQFPVAMEPKTDRRTWLLDELANEVPSNVMFAGYFRETIPEQLLGYPDVRIVSENPFLVLLTNNVLPTDTLLLRVGVNVRTH